MNNEAIRTMGDEKVSAVNKGFIISIVIILGSIIPNIETNWGSVTNQYSLEFLFFGTSILFFCMGVKVNMNDRIETVGNQQYAISTFPNNYTKLSISCFWISAILFISSLLILIF